jgi:hypothetical protein
MRRLFTATNTARTMTAPSAPARRPTRDGRGEENGGSDARDQRGGHDRGRAVGSVQRHDDERAANRRAQEVHTVERRELPWEARQREGHADPAEDEGNGHNHVRKHHRVHAEQRHPGCKRHRELGEQAEHDRDAEEQRAGAEAVRHPLGGEPGGSQVDDQRAHRHAEHGDGDGDEREVIPHGHAEDPGERDLVDDRGERDEK